ncbi:MAG: class I SAM-dependent methyltransferase [Thermoanaerobaculia bacterium]
MTSLWNVVSIPGSRLRRKASAAWRRFLHFFAAVEQAPDVNVPEALGPQLLALDSGLGLFRLVHLLDALTRQPIPRTAVSIGSGGGIHEAYLASRYPKMSVVGVDLRAPTVGIALPNLRFLQGDLLVSDFRQSIPPADFVFSIECLEHITDDASIFRAMASLVRPGGRLYLEVPFANDAEQADPDLCRRERDAFEHVRPGYSAQQLIARAENEGLQVLEVAGAFWFPTQPIVWVATQQLGVTSLLPHWRTFLSIAQLDVLPGRPGSRADATAIKLLAQRPL